MPFGPVDPDLDPVALESRVLRRWQDLDVRGKLVDLRRDGEPWVFYEGPPTANGRPGIHHVWARVFKDLYPRFHTMRGRKVPRKGGWDCHGLPVELEVEKELGLRSKVEIEAFGIAEFNRRCRESVHRYVEDWAALTERSGVWIDTADAYWTLSDDYIESVWWLVRQLWVQGLLYEGHRVSPYCARCGTALSSHELGQPDVYRDVVDPSVYVRFPLVGGSGGVPDADLVVWTTTPWTLISNSGAAVGHDIAYVQVRDPEGGRDMVMAEALAPEGAEVVARWQGSEMVGWRYERPFELVEAPDDGTDGWRVVAADFVSTDDGTGIVHLAPAFGEDDNRVGKAEGLPLLNPVTAQGTFDEGVAPWAGTFVKDADTSIIAELRARGLVVREQPYEHSYPHCWRCHTPLIYWAKTSWFVRTSTKRDLLMRENEKVDWHPSNIKHGRFGNWLEGNVDWALSRDRYWGTPLPIWRCESCSTDTCVGSVAELATLAGRDLSGLDLHRPYVDEVTFTCSCGGTAQRLAPVLDAWFDSGSMPIAQHHWPFSADAAAAPHGGPAGNGDLASTAKQTPAAPSAYPADFICEGIDQTRGWFYSLLAIGALVFDRTPYRNVVCLALVVDEDGQKMSKSRGNVIAPEQILDDEGADALRWYFFSQGQPWTSRRVYHDAIREAARQTLFTVWNVFSFFSTYADLDGWEPEAGAASGAGPQEPAHVLDRWVLSELDDTVATVTDALEAFDAFSAANRLARFVDDLSNWYVRRSRPRFWKAAEPEAHATLHECLVTTSLLLAPFCPFLADEMFTALTGQRSVHLADWPADRGRHDTDLAAQMAAARRIVTIGRSARTEAKVKVRQPLARALVLHPAGELTDEVAAEITSELNVKHLEGIDTLSGLMTWSLQPNFRTLGPRLGPKVNEVKQALAGADGSELKARLEADGYVEVAGERLEPGDVEARAQRHDAYALAEDDGWAVALDLEIDSALRAEGIARELVRALNDARKELGFAIADRISVTLDPPEPIRQAAEAHREWIAGEVLAESFTVAPVGTEPLDGNPPDVAGGTTTITVEGEETPVAIERL